MNQSEISKEIVDSTHRMLEQIKALEVCPNTPNGQNYRRINELQSQKQSTDVMNLISSLQTDQSEEILRDIHNWSDSRVQVYETYEKPLLDQMEINQKTDSSFIDEFSPRLEVNINNFDNKLTNAKVAVASLADSLIRQRCIDNENSNRNGNSEGYSTNILQFQNMEPNEINLQEQDEQVNDYEQLRLREEHLVQIVTELSNEVETMSNEAVSKNLEILNLQHEAEQKEKEFNEILENNKEKEGLILQFNNRIEELENLLEIEKKKVEELLSLNAEKAENEKNAENTENQPKIILPQFSESSSQTDAIEKVAEEVEAKGDPEEKEEKPVFRAIENFSLDIEGEERVDESFNDDRKSENSDVYKQKKRFAKFGEVKNTEDTNGGYGESASPNDEFESLLKLENEDPANSAGPSVLPLGIKQRRICTENGKRHQGDGWTFRLFFKDREGGAVIVDAEVAKRDERTGVMLLKPSDVRTARSPTKANRMALFGSYKDDDESEEKQNANEVVGADVRKSENESEVASKSGTKDNATNGNASKSDNQIPAAKNGCLNESSANHKNVRFNRINRNDAKSNTNSNAGRNLVAANRSSTNNHAGNDAKNCHITNNDNTSGENGNTNKVCQPKNGSNINGPVCGLTKQQEIMRKILEMHQRQMAKIKAARAAASYYVARTCAMPPEAIPNSHENAKIVNLNQSVERQISFNKGEMWSNFPSKSKNVVNASVVPPRLRMIQQKNRKIVVPGKSKNMKSPRKPFVL